MFSLSYPNFLLPAVLSRFSLPGCPVRAVLCRHSCSCCPAQAVEYKIKFFGNIFIIYAIFGEFRGNERAKMFASTLGTVFAYNNKSGLRDVDSAAQDHILNAMEQI
jgi:hypothetical protein